jgi:hypothetical protein
MVALETAYLRVTLDPGHGGEMRVLSEVGGVNLLASVAPRLPTGEKHDETGRLEWLADYAGGWQGLFPNVGPACLHDGMTMPFHGESSRGRWQIAALDSDFVTLRTAIGYPKLELERETRLARDGPVLIVRERATNVSSRPASVLWGHHPSFRLESDAWLDLPGARRPPMRLQAGKDRFEIVRPADGWAALRPVDHGPGIGIAWSRSLLPYLWIWQDAERGLVAIEPQSGPRFEGLAAAASASRALQIPPHGSREIWVAVFVQRQTTTRRVRWRANQHDASM